MKNTIPRNSELAFGILLFAGASIASETENAFLVEEGKIVSTDVRGTSLILKATIFAKDTFTIGKAAIIRPEKPNAMAKDLEPDLPVRVSYQRVKGEKVASTIFSLKEHWRESPPPIVQGNDVIVQEGAIHSIDDNGNSMIISVALEKQDTFTLDKSAVIRSGIGRSSLGEVSDMVAVQVRYVLEKGKKVIKEIVGAARGNRSDSVSGK
jgi:hypothetical protein